LGAITRFADYTYPPDLDLLVVRLAPTGLFHLLGRPVSAYTNQVIDLESIGLTDVAGFVEKLAALPPQERIKLLDNYLLREFALHSLKPSPVEAALAYIYQRQGVVSIEEITQQSASSRRHLVRLFHEQVGLSPKTFLRIFRFHQVVLAIKTNPNPSFQDVLYVYGYYDQSHFIRDFKALMGQLPSQFASEERAIVDYLNRL
jgi:AraC-like DNA-binding protein